MLTSLTTPSSWRNAKRNAAVVAANIVCHAVERVSTHPKKDGEESR